MKITILWAVTLVISLMGFCYATDTAADSAAYQTCIACHGANAEGNVEMNSPALAGQDAAYLARQLQNFKNGLRGTSAEDTAGGQMRAMVNTLAAEEDITAVSIYLAALPPATVASAAAGDLRNGENQYQGACGACHGGQAQGNAALNAPRLSGLDGIYFKRQMQNFSNGIRGAHPDDRYGRQMAMMADMLPTDKDLDDVIAFIQSQTGQ